MHDPPEHDAVVPRIESAALAVVLRAAQWALDDLAHDLPGGRATPARLAELATALEQLVALIRGEPPVDPGHGPGLVQH